MKKMVLFTIGYVICFIVVIANLVSTLNKSNEYGKSIVGKQVVLHKDTVLVLDYHVLPANAVLSNGATVSWDFVQLKCIDCK